MSSTAHQAISKSHSDTKVRVVYLTGLYPKVSHTFIVREVKALRRLGAEVLCCSVRRPPRSEVPSAEFQNEMDKTYYLVEEAKQHPFRLVTAFLRSFLFSPRGSISAIRLCWKMSSPGLNSLIWHIFYLFEAYLLADFMKKKGINHVHNHLGDSSGTVALLAAEIAGAKFSFTAHGPDIFFAPDYWRLDVKIEKAAFVASISHFCRSQLMLFSTPKNWDKIKIVRCGIEPNNYERQDKGSRQQQILFIGRLSSVKGVTVLLRSYANIAQDFQSSHLCLVGDGPERQDLEALSNELGLSDRVDFLGYKNEDEVADLLKDSELMVLPSFAEGLPVVLMEALASEVPVIATPVAGVIELVKHGETGFLVPPGDVSGLETAIRTILNDPDNAMELARSGAILVRQQHDVNCEAKKLIEYFEQNLN